MAFIITRNVVIIDLFGLDNSLEITQLFSAVRLLTLTYDNKVIDKYSQRICTQTSSVIGDVLLGSGVWISRLKPTF